MTIENPWLLPQGIEEALPERARALEGLRRDLLDLYRSWGYRLVVPPFIEFLESLLGDLGKDLDLKTFKLTDQVSGRLMGIRADMTPQVARIDAHVLGSEGPSRLCYMGTVLHTRASEFAASRSPFQVGCELYGHAGPQSDVEVLRLMVATLRAAGLDGFTLDLGHVGIFRGLARDAGLSTREEAELFDRLQRKSIPEIEQWLAERELPESQRRHLAALAHLNGGPEVIGQARAQLAGAPDDVLAAIDSVEAIAERLQRYEPALPLHIDLSELRGYHYKTGAVFAAYLPGQGREVARGGRYDGIGEVYGRARPATGFSTDLQALVAAVEPPAEEAGAILAPLGGDAAMEEAVSALRVRGERVIYALEGDQSDPGDLGCDRVLSQRNGQWQVDNI
ncbi:MAG: ATP phosphoribosyltransferase regulatory subunit [Pseudomonadota bacterium]